MHPETPDHKPQERLNVSASGAESGLFFSCSRLRFLPPSQETTRSTISFVLQESGIAQISITFVTFKPPPRSTGAPSGHTDTLMSHMSPPNPRTPPTPHLFSLLFPGSLVIACICYLADICWRAAKSDEASRTWAENCGYLFWADSCFASRGGCGGAFGVQLFFWVPAVFLFFFWPQYQW